MAEEQVQIPLLTGCQFLINPTSPTIGILRLDTKGGSFAVAISKVDLQELAKACQTYADGLQEA